MDNNHEEAILTMLGLTTLWMASLEKNSDLLTLYYYLIKSKEVIW